MIVQNITEAVIYESPDGGKTVYVRKSGDPVQSRQLHWESDEARELRETLAQNQLWNEIRHAAKTNPTLQRALDEAVMIYNLSK
jgi:hypothetical protein